MSYLQRFGLFGERRLNERHRALAERKDSAEVVQVEVGKDLLLNLQRERRRLIWSHWVISQRVIISYGYSQ